MQIFHYLKNNKHFCSAEQFSYSSAFFTKIYRNDVLPVNCDINEWIRQLELVSLSVWCLNSFTKMVVIYSQFSRAEEVPEPLYLVSVWLRSTSRTSILERYFYEKANNTSTRTGNKTLLNIEHMELS